MNSLAAVQAGNNQQLPLLIKNWLVKQNKLFSDVFSRTRSYIKNTLTTSQVARYLNRADYVAVLTVANAKYNPGTASTKRVMTMTKSMLQRVMLLIAMTFIPYGYAQPVGEQVIDSVEVKQGRTSCDPELAIIKMNFPVRYLTHFPQVTSDGLRIRIRPLQVSQIDAPALDERESSVPMYRVGNLLHEVIYEGDFQGGPYLSLIYNTVVRSRVIQASDYRTIKVIMYPPEQTDGSVCKIS